MPEILRSFLVVMAIAAVVFGVAQAYAKELGLDLATFKTRRNAWFVITAAAFLSHNFWVFCGIAAVALLYAKSKEKNILALAVFVLFAVPLFGSDISGLGIVNYFFRLDYFRLISLFILLPLYFNLRNEKIVVPFGKYTTDKFLLGYLLYSIVLNFPNNTLTNFLRIVFYQFIDVFLPYYVASRYSKNIQNLTDVLRAFVVGAVVVGCIGIVEFAKGWLLYNPLANALGVEYWGLGNYLKRGSSLRALSSTGQPIVLGYIMVVALGFSLYLTNYVDQKKYRNIAYVIIIAGLIASLSRGPWIGAILVLATYAAFGDKVGKNFIKGVLIAGLFVLFVALTPYYNNLIEYVPFLGQLDAENIEFRKNLLENSIAVISRNPWFGSADYILQPEMQDLEAQGIVDVVNSYIAIALSGGVIGLFLFVSIFITTAVRLFIRIRSKVNFDDVAYKMGKSLFAVMIGIVFMIYTVSSISFIPVIYWLFLGFCISYLNIYRMDLVGSARA